MTWYCLYTFILYVRYFTGAKVNATTSKGEQPLHYVARKADREMLTFLIEHGAKSDCPQCDKLKECRDISTATQEFIKQKEDGSRGAYIYDFTHPRHFRHESGFTVLQ